MDNPWFSPITSAQCAVKQSGIWVVGKHNLNLFIFDVSSR